MKLKEFFIIFLIVSLFAAGCGRKDKAAENPEDIIDLLREYSGKEEVMTLYTEDTVSEFKKFTELSGAGEKASYSILSFVPEKSEVEIAGEKCDKDICTLTIKFIEHPVENMKGFSFDIVMRKEGNNWKIDRSKDFREMSKGEKNNGAGLYLKSI